MCIGTCARRCFECRRRPPNGCISLEEATAQEPRLKAWVRPQPPSKPCKGDSTSHCASIRVHLVFSTKDRSPTIAEDIRPIMHEYLGGTVAALGSQSLGVGGTADHVHLLIELDRKACVADLTGKVKAASSKWMKQYQRGFTWQGGYGAFSFARTELRHLRSYVAQQEEHHRAVTFEDELRSLLHAHEMTWDERYLFD